MKFHEFGQKENPAIMMIHGGGNAWWNYLRQARALSDRFFVILPTLDGHGEEYLTKYCSTEDSAEKLIAYIEENCGGHLYALCGVSLGGQIVIEMLSQKPDVTQKAMIDGSICYPQRIMGYLCLATIKFCWKLMFSEKACRRQLAMLDKMKLQNMRFPEEIQEYYMQDMPNLPKKTLETIYHTYMMNYTLKESLKNTSAQVMYWYGQKELSCVKKSAKLFQTYVPTCQIYEAPNYNHGYLAIYLPDEWMSAAKPFLDTI